MPRISLTVSVCLVMTVAACATAPRARLQDQLMELGLSENRSICLADELDQRLDRRDLNSVAEFVSSLNSASTPGDGIDALMTIDNPQAAQAIGRAALACAF